MQRPHWHVLGAGAIGCLFACKLGTAGHPVTLLLRPDRRAATVTVRLDRDGASDIRQFPASTPRDPDHIDHLLVTTKAYDVCPALLSIAHRLDSDSEVLVLANGLGFGAELAARLPGLTVTYGTTTEGAYRIDNLHICHAGTGPTRLGRVGVSTPPAWYSHWAAAVTPSTWDPCIDRALWLKLAINCAINPLTALYRCRNGELGSTELRPQVTALCDEIMAVSEAAGLAKITAGLHEEVAMVIAGTAGNRSSMLQDIEAGRPTEIAYITGHLLAVARRHGVPAPRNEQLFRKVSGLDG